MPPAQTPWAKYPQWVNPVTTRSRLVLEIASELVSLPGSGMALRQAKVHLREQGQSDWPLCLFGSSTIEGVRAVVDKEADLAIINPAIMLTLAYRGTSVFKTPQPVRAISVIPSFDQYAFAVKSDTGLSTFEEIAAKRYPLRVSLRGMPDHSLHFMLDDILAAAGFSLADLRAWGGEARKDGFLPVPDGPKFQALARGEINAIFDEAADVWVEQALDAGMTILPLGEGTVRKLEAIGYRRGCLPKSLYPKLPGNILTIDFSGWPIFVHAEAPDELVTQFCAALEARKASIPWQGDGPLPLERMCRDTPETPRDVPFHPAAQRFWKERGYLP
jgi:TRAP-type uncharacterized transport system substrate-binding protein